MQNPLRLDASERAPKNTVWPLLLGIFIGLPMLAFFVLLTHGLSIPQYQSDARKFRKVCLEYIAPPDQQHVCEEKYQEAMRRGQSEADSQ